MKNINRVIELLKAVEQKGNVPLSNILDQFAKKWGMKKNSIRNIYYSMLNKAKQNNEFAKTIGINLDNFKHNTVIAFNKSEIDRLLSFVDSKVSSGYSVRKACNELANYDANLMLRYQNKYRSIKKKQITANKEKPRVVENTKKEPNKYTTIPENVVLFRKKEVRLSEKELQSLFMGLVRLVKTSAVAEVSVALKDQCNMQALEIRNLIKKMTGIKEELNESQRENIKLKRELEILKQDKVNDYAQFLTSLKIKGKQNLKSK